MSIRTINIVRSVVVIGSFLALSFMDKLEYPFRSVLQPLSLLAILVVIFSVLTWRVFVFNSKTGKYKTYRIKSKSYLTAIFQLMILCLLVVLFISLGNIDKADIVLIAVFAAIVGFNFWLDYRYSGFLHLGEKDLFVFPFGPWWRPGKKLRVKKLDETGEVRIELTGTGAFLSGFNSSAHVVKEDADRFLQDYQQSLNK